MSTAIRTSAFSFVGALSDHLYITQSAPLIVWISSAPCKAGWQGFGSSSLVIPPRVSTVVLFPPLHVGRPLGFAPEAALEGLGVPL